MRGTRARPAGHLLRRAGEGRVEHHRGEGLELRRQQRLAVQVAPHRLDPRARLPGRRRPARRRPPPTPSKAVTRPRAASGKLSVPIPA